MEFQESNPNEDDSEVKRAAARAAIVTTLVEKRSKAIRSRSASGIEQIWAEDEDAYENMYTGLDEWRTKPPGQRVANSQDGSSSEVGYNITGTYCDTGAASMGDMLFSTGDQPWSITATMIPDLVEISEGNIPPEVNRQIEKEAAEAGQDPEAVKARLIEESANDVSIANKKAKKVEERISDWLQECKFIAQCRTILEDCAKVGSGVIKGPTPTFRRKVAYVGGKLQEKTEIVPASRRIDYWNFFPDGDAGEDIHKGSYCFERDDITFKSLEELIGNPDYDSDEIIAALREGPHKATGDFKSMRNNTEMGLVRTNNTFEIWYTHASFNHDDILEAGFEVDEGEDGERRSSMIHLYVEMVNSRVIKITENPLLDGSFPYDVMNWKRRKGVPWGLGIARQLRTPQRMIDASIRNLMRNAGIASGPMLGVMKGVKPVDGIMTIKPWKIWQIDPTETNGITDINRVISYVNMPMLTAELNTIMDRGLKMAEDITGLPQLLQGQTGGAPDTVGGMTLLHNNSTALRRRIARQFDDFMTTPHIQRYFDFHLIYGPDDEKGDYSVVVKGSSTLVERDLHSQAVSNLAQMFLNPVYGKDPKKAADEYLKALKFNPELFDYDDEEWQQVVNNMSQPPSDPRVEIAQMKISHEQAMAQAKMEMENAFKQMDAENEQRKQRNEAELTLVEIEARLADTDRKIQASMTESLLKMDLQRQLSGVNSAPSTQQVVTPPTEPAGRAPDGQAYQK